MVAVQPAERNAKSEKMPTINKGPREAAGIYVCEFAGDNDLLCGASMVFLVMLVRGL